MLVGDPRSMDIMLSMLIDAEIASQSFYLRWDFVHNMLREHVQRLDELRTTEWRRSISAQKSP